MRRIRSSKSDSVRLGHNGQSALSLTGRSAAWQAPSALHASRPAAPNDRQPGSVPPFGSAAPNCATDSVRLVPQFDGRSDRGDGSYVCARGLPAHEFEEDWPDRAGVFLSEHDSPGSETAQHSAAACRSPAVSPAPETWRDDSESESEAWHAESEWHGSRGQSEGFAEEKELYSRRQSHSFSHEVQLSQNQSQSQKSFFTFTPAGHDGQQGQCDDVSTEVKGAEFFEFSSAERPGTEPTAAAPFARASAVPAHQQHGDSNAFGAFTQQRRRNDREHAQGQAHTARAGRTPRAGRQGPDAKTLEGRPDAKRALLRTSDTGSTFSAPQHSAHPSRSFLSLDKQQQAIPFSGSVAQDESEDDWISECASCHVLKQNLGRSASRECEHECCARCHGRIMGANFPSNTGAPLREPSTISMLSISPPASSPHHSPFHVSQ